MNCAIALVAVVLLVGLVWITIGLLNSGIDNDMSDDGGGDMFKHG